MITKPTLAPRSSKVNHPFPTGLTLIHLLLAVSSVLIMLPFLWMLLSSFKTFAESIKIPPLFFPQTIPARVFSGDKPWTYLFDNYAFLLNKIDYFPTLYGNTLALILGRILCALISSSMAAYAFSKLDFPLKKLLFSVVMIQLMLPDQVFIVPQYRMVVGLHWNNTIWGLMFPGLISAFGVFFMRQFYMGLPDELTDSAKIDGCNHWRIFSRVMLPMTKTPLMALSIFTAVFTWSNLMWPLIVNTENRAGTLTSALAKIQMMDQVFKAPHFMAASVLAMLPMILIYLSFQRQFVEGIALTGLKA